MSEPDAEPNFFEDGKDPTALRTIGEVARAVGIRQHVLRYWEEQFPELQPIKRSGGRRYYRPDDVALIVEIERLVHREGYTLRGASKAIADKVAAKRSADPVAHPVIKGSNEGNDAVDAFRSRLIDIRGRLAEALAAA